MENRKEILNADDYKCISDFVEKRLPILRKNIDFNRKYERLSDAIEGLDKKLSGEQKEAFNEIIQLFYETEEYYFAFSYSLGVKYGEYLKEL